MKDKVVALIDMGSNSIRLAIYKIDNTGNYQEIKKEKVAARLINYIGKDGILSQEGIQLIITTLKKFQKVMSAFETQEVIGFATAVIRQASNQAEILSEIKRQTDYSFNVLNEYEEAYYGYLGVIDSIELNDGITIDIGGGSTEITLFKDRELVEYYSFPFGAVSLNTKFTLGEQVTTKQLLNLKSYIFSQLQSISWLPNVQSPIIGIGGTARNLGRIYQAKYDTNQNDMKMIEIENILNDLSLLPVSERAKIKGLSKKRKDIIIPGIAIILTLMEIVQAPYFMFSTRSIRDGIVKERLHHGEDKKI